MIETYGTVIFDEDVIKDPQDPDPNRRYKGLGGDIVAFSPDGINWDMQPFPAAGKNDTSSSVVFWQGEYLAYVRNQGSWENGVMRKVALSTSTDFNSWTPKETIFTTDAEDGNPWTQPYALGVTPYGDQLIGILWLLHLDEIPGNNGLGDMDVQLMTSRDGRDWQRVAGRDVFLEPTPGAWDQGRIMVSTTMLLRDDQVYIYYTSSETRHGSGSWGTLGIGLVDETDAAILASNWQTLTGATWARGDFNGDGAVDDIDATILAGNWQAGRGGTSGTVPEPTILAGLLGLCLNCLYTYRFFTEFSG